MGIFFKIFGKDNNDSDANNSLDKVNNKEQSANDSSITNSVNVSRADDANSNIIKNEPVNADKSVAVNSVNVKQPNINNLVDVAVNKPSDDLTKAVNGSYGSNQNLTANSVMEKKASFDGVQSANTPIFPNNEVHEVKRAVDTYYERNNRYVLGDVAGTFKQIPYCSKKSDGVAFHRNDIVADIAKIGDLQVVSASLRGEAHYANNVPRQDSVLFEECVISDKQSFVVAAIADGVGNSRRADEFSEMLVNFLCQEISNVLRKSPSLDSINWNDISDFMWKIAVNYCYKKSGSEDLDEYFKNWASTLECLVVETKPGELSRYTAVTICGDGGIYLIANPNIWKAIKRGKTHKDSSISNMVYCLPDKPKDIIVRSGTLQRGETLFLTTDGLSDYIEAYNDVRCFFASKLPCKNNLPEFIKVLNVAVKQMDDDKSGVAISYYDETVNSGSTK